MYKAIVFVTDHQNRMYKALNISSPGRYCLKCFYSSGEKAIGSSPSSGNRLLFWCSGDASLLSFSLEAVLSVCSLDSSKGVGHL